MVEQQIIALSAIKEWNIKLSVLLDLYIKAQTCDKQQAIVIVVPITTTWSARLPDIWW